MTPRPRSPSAPFTMLSECRKYQFGPIQPMKQTIYAWPNLAHRADYLRMAHPHPFIHRQLTTVVIPSPHPPPRLISLTQTQALSAAARPLSLSMPVAESRLRSKCARATATRSPTPTPLRPSSPPVPTPGADAARLVLSLPVAGGRTAASHAPPGRASHARCHLRSEGGCGIRR